MKILADKLYQSLMSEKSTSLERRLNDYTMVVDRSLTKNDIKAAIKKMFNVEPLSVRTVVFRKKSKRTKGGETSPKVFKKAIIRLPEGQKIELR